jgi:type III pantothenate kinase
MLTMNLLIDIGNSRCKWALAASGNAMGVPARFVASGYLAPDDHLDAQLDSIGGIAGVPQSAVVVCVGGKDIMNAVLDAAQDRWPRLAIRHFKTTARAFGVTNAYAQADTLGADRWAALIAAHALVPQRDVVIADCGTAVTLDVLNAGGLHLGGYILPGLKMMREALHRGTASLPLADGQGASLAPARNTRDAIGGGALLGVAAAIEAVVHARAGNSGAATECLLTGGDAGEVAKNLAISCRYEPDLVLKGLAIAAGAEV